MCLPEPSEPTWNTTIDGSSIILAVDPEMDVAEAFSMLVPAAYRHLWVIEALEVPSVDGWERWILSRS